MDLEAVIYILTGSTFGLILRLFIKYNLSKKLGFYINNISIVNILSSFFLGILVGLNSINKNFYFLFYAGFLGCFSTFSSFIYQLFNLIQNKKYLSLLVYYIGFFGFSFLCFFLGYFIILIFKN